MYAFVHLPLCLFALCVCVYVGCVSSCVLFFSCFILYSPRLSYLSMLSQSVMSASLSPLCTFMFLRSLSSAFCPLLCHVPQFLVLLGKSCDSMYGVLPLWHHVNLCHLCSLSVLTSLVVLFFYCIQESEFGSYPACSAHSS